MMGDCAHVAFELAKELRKRGYTVNCITFKHDSRLRYLQALVSLFKVRFGKYDLVHAHYLRFPAYASLLSGKPFIVECHGSDVRQKQLNWLQKRCLKKAQKVLVSTSDLLEYLSDATYLPNPVGEQFRDYGEKKEGVIYFEHPLDETLPPIKKPYRIQERTIPYDDMPAFLNRYEYVINTHYSVPSKLGLEALACGCKLMMWDGRVLNGLPVEHKASVVVDQLIRVYDEAFGEMGKSE